MATLPPQLSNPLPGFSQLCRAAEIRKMIKFLPALWGEERCFPCWSSVFMSHQRMHAGGHPHGPKPLGTGPCWLRCALSLLVSSEGPSSYFSLPPLPITAHTVNLSHLKADRTELQPHASCGVALFSWTNAEFKQIRSLWCWQTCLLPIARVMWNTPNEVQSSGRF